MFHSPATCGNGRNRRRLRDRQEVSDQRQQKQKSCGHPMHAYRNQKLSSSHKWFWEGHGFSRAAKAHKRCGLQPVGETGFTLLLHLGDGFSEPSPGSIPTQAERVQVGESVESREVCTTVDHGTGSCTRGATSPSDDDPLSKSYGLRPCRAPWPTTSARRQRGIASRGRIPAACLQRRGR